MPVLTNTEAAKEFFARRDRYRAEFEEHIRPIAAKRGWNLSVINVNGRFNRYTDADIDNMFIGFQFGQVAERKKKEAQDAS